MHIHSILRMFWRNNPTEFTFPRVLKNLRKVLLILPRDKSSLLLARRWREKILSALGNKRAVILSIGAPLEEVEMWSQHYIFFTDGDVGNFDVISKRVIQAVRKENFKLAIDLSPDFDIITAQVPFRAKIPMRVGISDSAKKDVAEKYFNILYCRGSELNYNGIVSIFDTKGMQ